MTLFNSTEELRDTFDFQSLGVPIGTVMTLETRAPTRKLQVHLMGYEPGKSLLVSAPKRDGKEAILERNAPVVLRLLDGKKVCAFESKVLYRSVHPYSYYHLAYPSEIESLQVRSSERVNTLINGDIDSDFNIVGDWPKYAQITNLSRTGGRLTSHEALGEYGHELILRFELEVAGMLKEIAIAGHVRNIDQEDDQFGQTKHIVGVQFSGMSDEMRLALANYIYEHDSRSR